MNVQEKKDFFISYNKADQKIAEWIAWILEDAGYTTKIQAWDFLTGSNFVIEMQKASLLCEWTIAVLSQAYLNARFTQPEWAAAFSKDPTGESGALIPIRVEDFNVPGMLGNIVYIDLVGLDEADAQKKLINEIDARVKNTRRKPDKKPSFSPVSKKFSTGSKPAFNPIPVTFARLRIGSTDELVGRQDSLEWLDNKLLKSNRCTCALVSLQGMGGMGKTFLSQVFAEKNREKTMFYPVYLGETSPFNAGAQLLQKQGIDTSKIDTEKKLIAELQRFYQSCTGILILDDVRSADVETLLPEVDGWNVLVTTRDKTLARKLCGDTNVRELDVLSGDDAIQLMRNVLQGGFSESQSEVYGKLCEHLAFRPYSIRLAAGYLLNALDPSPLKLLERLKLGKAIAVDEDLGFNRITILLEDCLDQLEKKSLLAVKLVKALSVGADQGMPLDRFVQWQQSAIGHDEISIESALIAGRDSGIILVESEIYEGQERRILRLHSDLLRLLRKEDSRETVDSLIVFLEDLLVNRTIQPTLDRLMFLQVFSLVRRYKEDGTVIETLYEKLWDCLFRTGELKLAFYLGEVFTSFMLADGDRGVLQISYGNQAIILQNWGRLDEAMELHKKQEKICLELGNKYSLIASYNNQAIILQIRGNLEEAMNLLKKVEAFSREFGNTDSLQRCYCNQAIILQVWGRLEEAMVLYKKQEVICIEIGNWDSMVNCYGNQALILQALGKFEDALRMHKKEEMLCIKLGNRDGLQRSLSNQANCLRELGWLDKAMELYKRQEEICKDLGNKDMQISYGGQALVLQGWGKLNEAMELHKKEEKICIELGNRDGLQVCYGNQALILWRIGRYVEAVSFLKKQETICIEVALKPSLRRCYKNQIVFYNKMEKKKDADEVRKKLEALECELGGK